VFSIQCLLFQPSNLPTFTLHPSPFQMFSLTLLGGFYVEKDGSPISGFATDKARALLAYLAIERERPHRRESLAALFWPEQPEERARQSLRQALSNLRQVLAEKDSNPILTVANGDVQLSPQAHIRVDAQAFRALAQTCREHTHARLETCLPCLRRQREAVKLYAGEFLAGFGLPDSSTFDEWLLLTRENLQVEAVQMLALLAEYEERRGDFGAARQYALQQTRLEPWREEAYAQVMRLLAYEGQRSAALAQYAACCRALENELGLQPTQSTRLLAESIQKDSLPAPQIPPLPPSPPASFVGREREREEIAELLANPSCRVLTLLGPGGVGKTRLALQVALEHAGLYADGIHFVYLAGASEPSAALLLLADKLGLQTSPGVDPRKILCESLSRREMLIVLDNFEQLTAQSEAWSDFFRCAGGTKWLVTSREKLRLREEWVFGLEGLPVSDGNHSIFDARIPNIEYRVPSIAYQSFPAALRLFAERAAQAYRRFELTAANLPALAEICQMVEGLPLGIELAAATVAERTGDEIAAALRQTFDSLTPDLRNLPGRHASLRAVFEHSWGLLNPDECTCLAALSVFVGGFSAEAAQAVAEASGEQLAELIAKSLVRRDLGGRYALHETIRQFAAEKREDDGAVRERHGAYFAALAAQCAGADSASALDTLQMERANLRAAWEWSVVENVDLMVNLLKGLALLYTLRGPLSEGEELFCGALKTMGEDISKKELAANITLELARIYNAQACYDEAIALARSLPGSARCLLTEAQSLSAQGQGETARPLLEQALTLAREGGERRIEADCLRELGNVANRMAEYDVAVPLYRQSLEMARELGDRRGESATLNNWAMIAWNLGDFSAARAYYEQALTLYRALGNRLGEARALNNLSNVVAEQGDLPGSLVYSRQALEIHREMGNPRGQCAVLHNLGATHFCLKEYDAARTSYLGALVIYRESGNQQAEAEVLADLSLLDCVQGRLADGRKNALAAIALSESAGDKVCLANACFYLGRIEVADGNFDTAESTLQRALEIRQGLPHPGRIAEIQAELALAAFERGDKVLARERIAPVVESLSALEGAEEPGRIRELVEKIKTLIETK
jgi:predicted ATPase/DNA-binding SARP family transcriptional activator